MVLSIISEELDEDNEADADEEICSVHMTPWSTSPNLIEEFKRWLLSPDAKAVPPRQAKQNIAQVLKIWETVSEGSFEMRFLFDRKLIRDRWSANFEIIRKPATTKAYTSLRHFFYFIINDDPSDVADEFKRKCNSLIVTCSNWIGVYRKKQKKKPLGERPSATCTTVNS